MSSPRTPWPYAGSKAKEKSKIASFLAGSPRIVEPFCGTAFVSGTFSSSCILSDSQEDIVAIWEAARTQDEEFLRFAEDILVEGNRRQDLYYELREEYNELSRSRSDLDRKRDLFWFLLNSCHGSFPRWNRRGEFNAPFKLILLGDRRFEGTARVKLLFEWAKKVEETRASDALSFLRSRKFEGCTIYCDPPYAGSGISYSSGWNFSNLCELDGILRFHSKHGALCILQNYPCPEFEEFSGSDLVVRSSSSRKQRNGPPLRKDDVIHLYGNFSNFPVPLEI